MKVNVMGKLVFIIICVVAVLMLLLRAVGFGILYIVFRMKLKLKPAQTDYRFFEHNQIKIERGSFISSNRTLNSYLFSKDNAENKKLAVLAKGTGLFCPDYQELILELLDAGYDVYSFDVVDRYVNNSYYIPKGYQQWIIDLRGALAHIDKQYNYDALYFVGHSAGAYAVTAILKDYTDKVRAVATMATFNSGIEYAKMYYEKLPCFITKQMVYGAKDYNNIYYKKYADYSALDGVNSGAIAVVVYQGTKDKVLPINCSLSGYQEFVRNKNATFITIKEGGHNLFENKDIRKGIIDFLNRN